MRGDERIYSTLAQRLLVSCQAGTGDSFRDSHCMARFATAAVNAGAAGIRANGVDDIRAIRAVVSVPIIGVQKDIASDGRKLITPSFEAAHALVEAGADIVALDCTARGQRYGALSRLRRIRDELRVPVMADIAQVEEALAAAEAGAEIVASTMRGYTTETAGIQTFDPHFLAELARRVQVPVFAEGRIDTPEQAAAALRAGAFAVVVGTAITAPLRIAKRFVAALDREIERRKPRYVIGIDLGGTNTKFGVVSSDQGLLVQSVAATPREGGGEALLAHLKRVARECSRLAGENGLHPAMAGIATAGWVDPRAGNVVYATENLPGWTGTRIADELEPCLGMRIAVENDANALAVGERHFGLARGIDDFICITLGTGVGGGCYVGGRLNRGAHFLANALGHLPIEFDGLPCTCGLRGCLEPYTNAAALLRYGKPGGFTDTTEIIRAANAGNQAARHAIQTQSRHLAVGVASIVHLLDPELLILSGGLAQNNPALLEEFVPALGERLAVWTRHRVTVRISDLGYYGGILGAAAVAMERFGDLG